MITPYAAPQGTCTMPPVAAGEPNGGARTFADVMDDLIDVASNGVGSLRSLAKKMNELSPSQSADNWRTSLRRYRRETHNPSEETIALVAQAFDVPRETFPEAVTRGSEVAELQATVADHAARLAALERAGLPSAADLSPPP